MAQENKGSSVQRTHPLLYWMTIAYIVGLPNFIQFDVTGRTHEFGLFNVTSISRIALTLLTAYVLAVNLAMGRGPIFPRKIKMRLGVWLSLLVWCTIATILQPASRLSPHLATDLPLSLFRLGEWVLAFVLFLALYTREPVEHGTALVVELIGRTSWIIILMVWVALPFFPHLVYGSDETRSLAVLGGVFIIPGIVAFEACVAFYFALFFFRPGLPKWLGCSLALVTLEMTRSRTALVGFLLALVCYAFFYSRKAWLKWAAVGSFLLVGIAIVAFSKPLAEYVARGQSIDDVSTLDGRTAVWQASLDAIQARPLLGYGFVAGAKDAIKDHWIYPHWVPPNAHSELVQALLVGGLPALCLILYIYFFTLRGLLLGASGGREQLILFLIFIQFVIGGVVGGPTLSNVCSSMSGAFLLSCIASAECGRRTPERLQVSAPSFMAASRGRV